MRNAYYRHMEFQVFTFKFAILKALKIKEISYTLLLLQIYLNNCTDMFDSLPISPYKIVKIIGILIITSIQRNCKQTIYLLF